MQVRLDGVQGALGLTIGAQRMWRTGQCTRPRHQALPVVCCQTPRATLPTAHAQDGLQSLLACGRSRCRTSPAGGGKRQGKCVGSWEHACIGNSSSTSVRRATHGCDCPDSRGGHLLGVCLCCPTLSHLQNPLTHVPWPLHCAHIGMHPAAFDVGKEGRGAGRGGVNK